MRLRHVAAGALVALCAAGPLSAQTPLTLAEAIGAAVAHNPGLAAAAATVDEARLSAEAARATVLPRIVFTENWQRSNAPVFAFGARLSARRIDASHFAAPTLNTPGGVGLFRAALAVEQAWFDGSRGASIREARSQAEIAIRERDAAAAALSVAVTEAFGRIVGAEHAVRATSAGQAASREDLARAERRRDLGLATDADVLAVSVHVADLEQRRIRAAGDRAIAVAELNRLMGGPVTATVVVVEPTPDLLAPVDQPVEALVAEALDRRPEVRRSVLREQLASAERDRARAALTPRLVTQALVDLSGTSFSERASAWAIGGELRWSFSTGGADVAGIRAGAARIRRAEADAADVRAAVAVEVVSAYERFRHALARLTAGDAAVADAHERQRITRDRFDAGLNGTADVLQAAAAVLAAESNRTTALVDALVSRAALAQAVGRTLP